MKRQFLIASALLVTFAGTAMANEYYVVRGPDRHCTITTTRPADSTVVTQIGPLAFESRQEAEGRIKETKVCSDSSTNGSDTVIEKDNDED
jgi:hypothetical protein